MPAAIGSDIETPVMSYGGYGQELGSPGAGIAGSNEQIISSTVDDEEEEKKMILFLVDWIQARMSRLVVSRIRFSVSHFRCSLITIVIKFWKCKLAWKRSP